ncbi:DUF3556 domain-containing protein [Pseudonocardia spinosispora]|uniref:DUF3556 domain-containing protein n=1 Tax=Pseudonocardia spinosispora TaxID=103441 RepID=UPI0003F4F9BD|nr:DUF3556 domain-containing protein [Pseudonocardia spinosispora]
MGRAGRAAEDPDLEPVVRGRQPRLRPADHAVHPADRRILHWLRPGTVRPPPWLGKVPFTRGSFWNWFDVLLFAGLLKSHSLGSDRQHYRLVDAAGGVDETGCISVADMMDRQPWDIDDMPAVVLSQASPQAPASVAAVLPRRPAPDEPLALPVAPEATVEEALSVFPQPSAPGTERHPPRTRIW